MNGVMIHHTVTSGTDSSVALCYDGYAPPPGPLCHGVIDKKGHVHMVGNGRASHAALGDGDVLRAVVNETKLPPDNEAVASCFCDRSIPVGWAPALAGQAET
ncbi:hypothetical protein GCM10022233_80700 [Streptomyces shaanxiensis]|uniref:N-acetylmuramoyl-L-alanine amidase domain-containing protein n=1 Tax=Streptomyces shaanxiensis TaxID=653357 RepID=A0ABP7WDI6_9ACTN